MAFRGKKARYNTKRGREISSVGDALSITAALHVTRREFTVYRGQPVGDFSLRPTAFRRARWYRHERDMVRELISIHPQEFVTDTLMLDRLVRMQHYGLPTRLLDVTQNFLAALYFACGHDPEHPEADGSVFVINGSNSLRKYYDSDSVSLVTNICNLSEKEKLDLHANAPPNDLSAENDSFNKFPPTDRLLQFVRDEKPYFRSRAIRDDLHKTFLVIPKKNNRRIVAQSGAFLVFGLVGADRNPDLSMFEITRHNVPRAQKDTITAALEALGITSSSLFPEIDKAAAFISERFKNS